MWSTLSGRLALVLASLFLAGGAALMASSMPMPQLRELLEAGIGLLAASIAFAMLVALLVFRLLARRLHLLAREMDDFRSSRFTRPKHLAWARDDGDAIDRLACTFGQMSHHIAQQFAELERHDAQRRELLANVSHDLRTPLTLMQGYLETLLIRRGELDPAEERSCLEVAARHAERLGRLVADLFELAKLDGHAGRIQPEVFSLTELAQDIAQKFSLHASSAGVRIALQVQPLCPPVRGDIGMVERALENLVENALRHTPAGGEVRIEVEALGAGVYVRVRDTGCGIAREDLPHLFERYFQAPRVEGLARGPGDDTAAHHAGLGLAITQRIVALHGSEIEVSSELGRGTVFGFALPAASQMAPMAAAPLSREMLEPCASGPS
jgi:signal transduction histidine kinase